MKSKVSLIITSLLLLLMGSCKKETPGLKIDIAYNMLTNKIWYLDHIQEGGVIKSYVGQTTYSITFLKNNTTKDSDGYTGLYLIENQNNQLQIRVSALSVNNNSISYVHSIETIGDTKMILSYFPSGQTQKTKLFYTSKN